MMGKLEMMNLEGLNIFSFLIPGSFGSVHGGRDRTENNVRSSGQIYSSPHNHTPVNIYQIYIKGRGTYIHF